MSALRDVMCCNSLFSRMGRSSINRRRRKNSIIGQVRFLHSRSEGPRFGALRICWNVRTDRPVSRHSWLRCSASLKSLSEGLLPRFSICCFCISIWAAFCIFMLHAALYQFFAGSPAGLQERRVGGSSIAFDVDQQMRPVDEFSATSTFKVLQFSHIPRYCP